MQDWIIVVTNDVNNNVNLFRFYGTDSEVCHKLQAMVLEDCRECRSSDLQVDESSNSRYKRQYQLVVPCDDGKVVYTATELAAVDYLK